MTRHALSTRLWHWLSLPCIITLFMSGLTISNAHPRLYWGDWGFAAEHAWLSLPRWPGWMTIPGHYNLALARDWHILMAWPFALLLTFLWAAMLVNRHFARDIVPRAREWRWTAIAADLKAHARLDFRHPDSSHYNFLQKLLYAFVLAAALPMMVVTGLAISPGFEPAAPWLVDVLGGRQSARSLHFLFAFSVFGFALVHVLALMLAGPWRLIRDMVTGGRA